MLNADWPFPCHHSCSVSFCLSLWALRSLSASLHSYPLLSKQPEAFGGLSESATDWTCLGGSTGGCGWSQGAAAWFPFSWSRKTKIRDGKWKKAVYPFRLQNWRDWQLIAIFVPMKILIVQTNKSHLIANFEGVSSRIDNIQILSGREGKPWLAMVSKRFPAYGWYGKRKKSLC